MSLSTQPIVGNATPAPKFEDKRLLQLIKHYLRTNKTSVFLGEIVKTYESQNLISHGGKAPEYCIDKEIVELLERPANAGWRTKFTLSCLTAIKSTIYHNNFKPAAKVLLHSAKLFGNRMRYRNDQDKVIIHQIENIVPKMDGYILLDCQCRGTFLLRGTIYWTIEFLYIRWRSFCLILIQTEH